jgi:kelch-like protein 10
MCSGEKFNPTTDTWMQIPVISHPHMNFGTAVPDDTIFIIGGLKDATLMNVVEWYDEKSNELLQEI